jgi:hypothetical protein
MTDINPVFKNLPTEIKHNICLYIKNFKLRFHKKLNKFELVSVIDLKSNYWQGFELDYKCCVLRKKWEIKCETDIIPYERNRNFKVSIDKWGNLHTQLFLRVTLPEEN